MSCLQFPGPAHGCGHARGHSATSLPPRRAGGRWMWQRLRAACWPMYCVSHRAARDVQMEQRVCDDSTAEVWEGRGAAPVFRPWCWGRTEVWPWTEDSALPQACMCCEGRHLLLETRLQGEKSEEGRPWFHRAQVLRTPTWWPPRTHCAGEAPGIAGGSAPPVGAQRAPAGNIKRTFC